MECTNYCLFKSQRMFFQHDTTSPEKKKSAVLLSKKFWFHSWCRVTPDSKHHQKINKSSQCSGRNCKDTCSLRCPILGLFNANFYHTIIVYISSLSHNEKGKVFSNSSKKETSLFSPSAVTLVLRKFLLQKHKFIMQEKWLKLSGGAKGALIAFGKGQSIGRIRFPLRLHFPCSSSDMRISSPSQPPSFAQNNVLQQKKTI